MSLRKIFFLVGVWLAILPFLGFPTNIRKILISLGGFGIIVLSYSIKNHKEEEMQDLGVVEQQ